MPLKIASIGSEAEIEQKLLDALQRDARSVVIRNSSFPSVRNFADLLKNLPYESIHDDSRWNPSTDFMPDIIGNMTPDIVLRSNETGENRVCIEVKNTQKLGDGHHYHIEDSQVVRYFLHLLATTKKNPNDIGRAMLLCAPSRWFADSHNAKAWGHFIEHFSGLATKFHIAIGEIDADKL
jgi:hypothetical protein